MGSDDPDESEDWDGRPRENVFTNNIISDTLNGVKIQAGDDNVFTCESGIEILSIHALLLSVLCTGSYLVLLVVTVYQ